jgi:hypothetical protein
MVELVSDSAALAENSRTGRTKAWIRLNTPTLKDGTADA